MRKILFLFLIVTVSTPIFAMMADAPKDQPLTKALYKTGMTIIDVRTEPEWFSTGIVKGSKTLMFFDEKGKYDTKDFLSKLSRMVDKNETFAIICRTGNRTTAISKFLRKVGYKKVINIKGGIKAAMKKDIPIEPYKK